MNKEKKSWVVQSKSCRKIAKALRHDNIVGAKKKWPGFLEPGKYAIAHNEKMAKRCDKIAELLEDREKKK